MAQVLGPPSGAAEREARAHKSRLADEHLQKNSWWLRGVGSYPWSLVCGTRWVPLSLPAIGRRLTPIVTPQGLSGKGRFGAMVFA